MIRPVLLAPAGNMECLSAALRNGADAVYFGAGPLNMRSSAAVNFPVSGLREAAETCHASGARAWLALNTILYDSDLKDAETLCAEARKAGVDAVIAADPAAVILARKYGLPVHLSVQMNLSNLEAVAFWARYADAAVLARELRIDQIAEIRRGILEREIRGPSGKLLEIEVFAHGALCMAHSGRCYLSLALTGKSANRGECLQPCRRAYRVSDAVTGAEVKLDQPYLFSPEDLCTIGILPRLLEAGVGIFKIEGRGRGADYVAAVTKVYREALDAGKNAGEAERKAWISRLERVFNRGFWHGGYYLGEPSEGACSPGSRATERKEFAGTVVNWYARQSVAECRLTGGGIALGDELLATGPTTGAVRFQPSELRIDGISAESAAKGITVTFSSPERLRENDKLYRLVKTSGNAC